MNIGAAIKELRKSSKLNQTQFAELTGISQTYISQVESGTKTAHTGTLLTIAAALNTSLAVIYIMAIGSDDITSTDQDYPNAVFMLETGKALLLKAL